MKLAVVLCALVGLLLGNAKAWSSASQKSGAPGNRSVKQKRMTKQELTGKKAQLLRKQAEKDARRHQQEALRREYQLMLEAQQRGGRQMQEQQRRDQLPPATLNK